MGADDWRVAPVSSPSWDDDGWLDRLEEQLDSQDSPNRPRTKRRPRHDAAVTGRVIGVDRGRYRIVTESDGLNHVSANRARELRRESIVVGDMVDLVGDLSGDEGTLARIVRIQPRKNVLRRSADDSDHVERVIVANVDQLLMVVAAADPEPRPRLIDRYVVAALDAGIDPILCVTKTDLAPATPLRDYAGGLDIPMLSLRNDGAPDDFSALEELLSGKITVAVGHSGVGKSTLVNRLVPEANRDVGDVNVVTGRGRHTSSSSSALWLPSGGWIIDTPGVRSFGLGHVSGEAIDRGFPDLAHLLEQCPRGCQHSADEADCALAIALESGEIEDRELHRIESLRRLRELSQAADR